SGNFLESVKAQYEQLPYPPREPELEKRRLIHKIGDNLIILNHHCYGGSRDFSRGFRALVAGGGTGDSTIYLAEQLRELGGEVVYLDMSAASMAIARERARIRDLGNIHWRLASLLDLPSLNLGQFDYINCTGVLHHLESPEAGLRVLKGALKPDGVILLMLYGKYGRRSVYDMQALLRAYLPPDLGIGDKIRLTRELLATLPGTNSFVRDLDTWSLEISPQGFGDSGLYDLLLHSQDRCFDVPEIHSLAASAELDLLNFVDRADAYDPRTLLPAAALPARFARMALRDRQAMAELIVGDLAAHEFYLGRRDVHRAAGLHDEDNTLVLMGRMHGQHAAIANGLTPGRTITFEGRSGKLTITGTPVNRQLFACMDARTPLGKVFKTILRNCPGIDRAAIRQELADLYARMHGHGHLFLLKKGSYGTRVPDYSRLQPF
ncbi:MAG: class I SAM-dependent methyltransferase, partial [Gammaproteobacteria bacterium]|nr:class I SAM-dependent methyltransferase [Gammaproteobacteria bacterium]